MEFFQTIWTALTTPNERLITFIGIPFTFIEIYLYTLLFTTILDISPTKKQKTFYIVIYSLGTILSNFFIPKQYSVFLNIVLCYILIMTIFKTSILKGILAELLPLIVNSVIEIFISKLYLTFLHIDYLSASTIPIYRESIVITSYLCLFLIIKSAKKIDFNISLLDNMNKKSKWILIINFFIGIVSIGTQLYLSSFYNETLPFYITILSIFILLAYFFTNIYSLTRTTQLQIATQNLEESQLYNKSLKILHDTNRAFKHDFNNIVQAIGGYIGTNDMDGLKTYYSQLLDDCQKVNNLTTLSPDVINNPAIYSILTSKYHKADELGIKINLEIFLNLNELNMKIYEFTRILGILMDNAIEATIECESKIINVEIRKDFKVNRQVLIIENSYKNKDVDIDRIFEKGFSSKPKNTGLGLWEVRQILKKNTNLNLYTTKDSQLFKQQLEIYPLK